MAQYPEKILLLTRRLRPDGPSALIMQLSRALQSRGFSVNLLCGRSSLQPNQTKGVKVREWAAMFEKMPFRMLFGEAGRVVDDFKPDLVHVMGQDIGYTGFRILTNSPVPFVMTAFPPVKAYRAFGRLSRQSECILAWSEDVREDLVNDLGCAKSKVAIVPPGIDVDYYPPRYSFSSERPPTVGVAGNISSKCGFDTFLDAAAGILKACPEANFVVAGDGGAERHLRAKALKMEIAGAISFVQRVSDYSQPMECMDIIVEPTLVEIFPATLLQAMAFGKAVVASGVGGVYSLIEDGRTGLLVTKGDSGSIARAVISLIKNQDKARELANNARSDVRERFNMEQKLDRLMPVYEQAVKKSRQAALSVGR